ncbi:CatB-related O-acetyltransferase [Neobacillus sp. YIM B06451]|uniref:CatB-related O-acetyltransferase n=1 Tax=Neobacillus sp. YIM B06451 TaxID=3070994 RepID=UPI00292EFE27|nr:CatB-related O-acetyltransferase [Neobacillus sp. YIM B06451]
MFSPIKREIKRLFYNFKERRKSILLKNKVIINKETKLAGNNKIYSGTNISNSFIGFGTYISNDCDLRNTVIGRYSCIAPDVKVVFGSHPITKFVSIHPAFYSTHCQAGFTFVDNNKFFEHKFADVLNSKSVIIENDVWIGQGVRIMAGVKIATGSVIGAGAIVTKNTEPYSINLGIPAKKVGYRFDEDQIEFLLKYEWWEKDMSWLKNNQQLFEDVELLYEKFCSKKD